MRSSDFRKLIVWQKAMDLTMEVYSLVKLLPREENYCLSDQMRRAAVSVPANIAEGQGRDTDKEYNRFISIARGSLWELLTHIDICERLSYISAVQSAKARDLITEISKMLVALSKSITPKQESKV
jgi:four helix bundle protein